jgi:hypothetical protein
MRKYQVPLLASLVHIRVCTMRILGDLPSGSSKAYLAILLLYRVRFLALVAGIS